MTKVNSFRHSQLTYLRNVLSMAKMAINCPAQKINIHFNVSDLDFSISARNSSFTFSRSDLVASSFLDSLSTLLNISTKASDASSPNLSRNARRYRYHAHGSIIP